jgi:hypothetical protein
MAFQAAVIFQEDDYGLDLDHEIELKDFEKHG